MERFIKIDEGEVDSVLIDADRELSQKVGMTLAKSALEMHQLATSNMVGQKRQDGTVITVNDEDHREMCDMTEDQKLISGMMMMMSLIFQIAEKQGIGLQTTILAVVAEEIKRWGNSDQLHVMEVLQGLVMSRKEQLN